MSDGSIQFKRPHTGQCFDDAGDPCGSVDFDFDAIDAHLAEQEQGDTLKSFTLNNLADAPGEISITREELDEMLAAARVTGAKKLLDFITDSDDYSPKAIGHRALVSSYLLRGSRWATQRQLAKMMRITAGRASQQIKDMRHHMSFLNAVLAQRGKAGVRQSGIDRGKS
jgi:hypothetical protein